MAWRPPLSSTLTHISLIDQPRRSPNSSSPISAMHGVTSVATCTSSGLSPGLSIAVCDSAPDELFSRVACALKCSTRPATRRASSVAGARRKGVGNSGITSLIARKSGARS